jgi:RHS repeat-associated protein
MKVFTIDRDDHIAVYAAAEQVPAGDHIRSFSHQGELARLLEFLSGAELVQIWNRFAGVTPFGELKPVRKFTDRQAAITRIWKAVQRLEPLWAGSIGHFYPYGQEKPSAAANGTEKFTGYLRDAETGNDYAINRYHVPGMGRFLTPDPYMNSAGPTDPDTWNRYAYTGGDPVNRVDRGGTCDTYTFAEDSNDPDCDPSGGGEGDPTYCDLNPTDPICSPYPLSTNPANPVQGTPTQGPGQSATTFTVTVTGLTTTGANYQKVANIFEDISDVIGSVDPNCLTFLQSGGENLESYISSLISNNLLAVGNVSPNSIAAFTGVGGTNLSPGQAAIVVNNNGAFFNSGYTVGDRKYQGGTIQADVFIVLHELGHALGANGFLADGPSSNLTQRQAAANGNHNDQLIQNNCSKLIQWFN